MITSVRTNAAQRIQAQAGFSDIRADSDISVGTEVTFKFGESNFTGKTTSKRVQEPAIKELPDGSWEYHATKKMWGYHIKVGSRMFFIDEKRVKRA
jgi:hypothetical protein